MTEIPNSFAPAPSLPPPASDVLLRADNLTKLFVPRTSSGGSVLRAVDNVSLYVDTGETLAVVGESGSGKTTLGLLLLRLLEPTFGQVLFAGEVLTSLPTRALRPIRKMMQPVFQDPHTTLNPRLSVLDIVAEGIEIHRLADSYEAKRRQVMRTLDQVGLPASLLHTKPEQLSAGDRQRVSLARALAVNPQFIVCDEAMSALDVSVQNQLTNLLLTLQDRKQLALLFISHNLRLVGHLSHRVAVMYAGRIVETGPTQAVASGRLHPYTRALYDAAPAYAPGPRRLRVILEGEAPDLSAPPSGCVFHPRCPRSEAGLCDREPPPLQEYSAAPGHLVACHHPHL